MGRITAVAVAACAVAGAATAPAALGGTPSFGTSQSFATESPGTWGYALGRLDGDADLDVIGAADGILTSLRGAAGTAFGGISKHVLADGSTGEMGVAIADVDGDGRNDALANLENSGGLFSVSHGLGTGAFTTPVSIASGTYRGGPFATGDFNQDGDPDVAMLAKVSSTATTGSLVIMQGAAGTAFTRTQALSTPLPGRRRWLRAGKLNGDADPDLVALFPGNVVRVYRGAGGSTFGAPLSYATGPTPRDVAIGSLNGDAHPDFAVAYRTGLQFFFGKADGTFAQQAFPDDYEDLRSVNIADVDGDGQHDVVLADASPYRVVVLGGSGTGGFTKVLEIAGAAPYLEVADLDGDRAPDLLSGSPEVNTRRNTTPRADLAAKLTAPATATTTADVKYTLGTTNAGPTTATGVVLTLDLPASFTYKAAPTGCTYTSILRRVTCTVGSLGSGATASRVITVRPTAKGQFPATARVTSARGDFNRANNAVAAITTVN